MSLTGSLSRGDIDRFLSTADVAVPSDPGNLFNDASSMIKTLEYMAYGCPIAQFDLIEGRRSAGNASLYAQSNDTVDFAKQISRLLNSEAWRHKLGHNGRTRIEPQVNWASERATLPKAYETPWRRADVYYGPHNPPWRGRSKADLKSAA